MPLFNPLDVPRGRFAHQDLVGVVVDNADPEKRQRVRVRIPQLHRTLPDDKLPWAIPDASQSRANAGGGAGSVNVPVKGAKIYVRFEENDPHNPRYAGSPTTDDVNKDNELLNENYPHTRGSIDDAGNRISTNSENEVLDFVHKSGSTVHIDANGKISVTVANNHEIGVNGRYQLEISGEGVIRSSTKLTFEAPTYEFKFGAASPSPVSQRTRPTISDPSNNTNY